MTPDRYNSLMRDDSLKLTPEEINEGWHFCSEWDCLLVGPGMGELEPCRCLPDDHPVYKTKPDCGKLTTTSVNIDPFGIYLKFKDSKAARTQKINDSPLVTIDYDTDGSMVGIEIACTIPDVALDGVKALETPEEF